MHKYNWENVAGYFDAVNIFGFAFIKRIKNDILKNQTTFIQGSVWIASRIKDVYSLISH